MAKSYSRKSKKDKGAEQADGRVPERDENTLSLNTEKDVMFLQRAAGNKAVTELIQTTQEGTLPLSDAVPAEVQDVLRSPGQPLAPAIRTDMESRFGRDFARVRVHTDAQAAESAQAISAEAYTVGRDIVLREGHQASGTSTSQTLLAHELAHVVQQDTDDAASPAVDRSNLTPSLETEAEQAAADAARGGEVHITGSAPAGMIQRSPLSDDLDRIWRTTEVRPKKGAIFDRLRALTPGSGAADRHTLDWLARTFEADSDDLWLARTILEHGPEPLWPDTALTERHRRAREHQWPDEPGHIGASLGTTAGGLQVRAFYFPGISNERALIIGGVHGSELSGIEVAEMLAEDLRNGTRPYYTVIIVPRLFPDNAARAERARSSGRVGPNEDSNIGRFVGRLDPNRNFPGLGESLTAARRRGGRRGPVDARRRRILAENVMLLELIRRFRPSRIASVHAKRLTGRARRGRAAPGIFADPHTTVPGTSAEARQEARDATARDADLALRMAKLARKRGARVPGNWLGTDRPTAVYGPATHQRGVSLGGWGPRAVSEGGPGDRASMTVITVEVQHYAPSSVFGTEAEREARRRELRAHRDALREIFLRRP